MNVKFLFFFFLITISLNAQVIYVKADAAGLNNGTSWANAYVNLQDAINEAETTNKSIWVAADSYFPTQTNPVFSGTDTRKQTFYIAKDIKIFGGFSGVENSLDERNFNNNHSILSGDIGTAGDSTDNVYHVLFIDGVTNNAITSNCIIDGLIIEKGRANGSFPDIFGAGIYNYGANGACNPQINNCTFLNNSTPASGGGIYNDGADGISNPIINNCSFTSNSAFYGGAIYNYGDDGDSSPEINNCIFYKNFTFGSGDGGAIFNDGTSGNSRAKINNCMFKDNFTKFGDGGAVYNSGGRSSLKGTCIPIFTNCSFLDNISDDFGGAIANDCQRTGESSSILINCLFTGNTSERGGAMYNHAFDGRSKSQVINCTFSNNTSTKNGGAIYSADSGDSEVTLQISNSILWLNNANGNSSDSSASLFNFLDVETTISHSIIANSGGSNNWNIDLGIDGGNNLDIDPLFVNINEDLRLQSSSPAINVGNNNAIPMEITTDLDGNTRVFEETVDMGAYEKGEEGPLNCYSIADIVEFADENPVLMTNTTYLAKQTLSSINTINGDMDITFGAGETVILKSGFHAVAGSSFRAIITDCNLPTTFNKPSQNRLNVTTKIPFQNKSEIDLKIAPNPFKHSAVLSFQLPKKEQLSINIYAVTGQQQLNLVPVQFYKAGKHELVIEGSQLNSGFYFVVLQSPSFQKMKKIMIGR